MVKNQQYNPAHLDWLVDASERRDPFHRLRQADRQNQCPPGPVGYAQTQCRGVIELRAVRDFTHERNARRTPFFGNAYFGFSPELVSKADETRTGQRPSPPAVAKCRTRSRQGARSSILRLGWLRVCRRRWEFSTTLFRSEPFFWGRSPPGREPVGASGAGRRLDGWIHT